jgi:bifunctional DNA-binding transcriptional regulator/antitoxin component of YhaV-PrlF toxin-antitoxin module
MLATTLSDEGQIVLPPEIQTYLKLQPGSRVKFVIDISGVVKLLPLNHPVTNLAAMLHRSHQEPVSLEQMEQVIQEHVNDWT